MPSWQGSDRRSTLPGDWSSRRKRVFERDGFRCTATLSDGSRCKRTEKLECDHVGDNADHRYENLTTLCSWHHGTKSGQQGQRAAAAKRREVSQRFRRSEPHPGSLR